MVIQNLLQETMEQKASDLHIIPSHRPTIRINGELIALTSYPELTDEVARRLLESILTNEQKDDLMTGRELDFAYELDENRFRVNVYFARGSLCASFRVITTHIKTLEELKLPTTFYNFAQYKQGLILVTGPTGEGKSTTIASIINEINVKSARHILTIEDPIEYVYPKGRSIISQREVKRDTNSWNVALRSAFREDPDVVLIGEMRDYETIAAALTIAETGHLVFSTLHTNSAAQTIDRIVNVFPSRQQNQIRLQLSSELAVVISQRLLPNSDSTGRLPACEVLINNSAIASVIREAKTHLLNNILETSSAEGMILLEKYLFMLYKQGSITKDVALRYAIRRKQMLKLIG